MKYQLGQIVNLRSGGPDMTVVSVISEPYEIYKCSWFDAEAHYSTCDFDVHELCGDSKGIGFNRD